MGQLYIDEHMQGIPAPDSQIGNEQLHRYRAAARFVRGKQVLDAACGSGYGSAILAEAAQSVVAIDYSGDGIDRFRKAYQRDNLSFQSMSATNFRFPNGSFDTVVSFKTPEYLSREDRELFLAEIRRVLAKDGFLIMSSPGSGIPEQTQEEFKALLSGYFPYVKFYYQSHHAASLIIPAEARSALQVHCPENCAGPGTGLIAICGNQPPEEDLSGICLQETAQAITENQYAQLAKAYLRLEQAYADVMLKYSRTKALEEELTQTEERLAGVLTSLSWKVTAPIRKIMEFFRRRSHGT